MIRFRNKLVPAYLDFKQFSEEKTVDRFAVEMVKMLSPRPQKSSFASHKDWQERILSQASVVTNTGQVIAEWFNDFLFSGQKYLEFHYDVIRFVVVLWNVGCLIS